MRRRLILLAATIFILACGKEPLHDAAPAELTIENAWIRSAPPGAHMLAGYLDIVNSEPVAIQVVAAACEGFGTTEMHRTELENDVARMRRQDLVTVPADTTVSFAPGGLHLMLHEPAGRLDNGAAVNCTLQLADGRQLSFAATVKPTGASGAGNGGTH